ncbi:MAG: hypothetical protein AAFN10_11580 [Bacteroidota bacterium]
MLMYSLSSLPLWGQDYVNPAEKYLDAYKQYLTATCPIAADSIQHFVYFSRDREAIIEHPFLQHKRFVGAQIMYAWRQLEPQKGEYDFSEIKEDLRYLSKHQKKLFIQLQDVSFDSKYKAVPNYLLSPAYAGGAYEEYSDQGKPEGWVAKRWNKAVQERFKLLLSALGEAFDGKIEGINLQETAIGANPKRVPDFSETQYVAGLQANMLAMKQAFPHSTCMIYANFMPGEWLPWEDKGYLQSIYQYGEEIGVGLGSPDLLVRRKGQLNHPIKFMHEGDFSVPIGIAVQDGNYIAKTGADQDYHEQKDQGANNRANKVPLLQAFAKDFLNVSYMFWVNQEPYFEEDVLSCFENKN